MEQLIRQYFIGTLMIFIIISSSNLSAQISNIQFYPADENIIITYDFKGNNLTTYDIAVYAKGEMINQNGQPISKYRIINASGDFGKKIKPGTNKRISWNALKDIKTISGEPKFEVLVYEISRLYLPLYFGLEIPLDLDFEPFELEPRYGFRLSFGINKKLNESFRLVPQLIYSRGYYHFQTNEPQELTVDMSGLSVNVELSTMLILGLGARYNRILSDNKLVTDNLNKNLFGANFYWGFRWKSIGFTQGTSIYPQSKIDENGLLRGINTLLFYRF